MRAYAEGPRTADLAVIDADTGQVLRGVTWVDTETGEYEQLRHTIGEDGRPQYDMLNGELVPEVKRGNIRVVPKSEVNTHD